MCYWSLHIIPTTVMGMEVDKVTTTSVDTCDGLVKNVSGVCASSMPVPLRFRSDITERTFHL